MHCSTYANSVVFACIAFIVIESARTSNEENLSMICQKGSNQTSLKYFACGGKDVARLAIKFPHVDNARPIVGVVYGLSGAMKSRIQSFKYYMTVFFKSSSRSAKKFVMLSINGRYKSKLAITDREQDQLAAVGYLVAAEGPMCPMPLMQAAMKVGYHVSDGSWIFIFTDAIAFDYDSAKKLHQLLHPRSVKVNIIFLKSEAFCHNIQPVNNEIRHGSKNVWDKNFLSIIDKDGGNRSSNSEMDYLQARHVTAYLPLQDSEPMSKFYSISVTVSTVIFIIVMIAAAFYFYYRDKAQCIQYYQTLQLYCQLCGRALTAMVNERNS